MNYLLGLIILGLACAALISIYRIVQGPSNIDRVLALDFLGQVCVGATIIMYVAERSSVILDLGILMALVSFFSALIFASYFSEDKS